MAEVVRPEPDVRTDPRSISEHAMGCRYAYERHEALDDGKPAWPITDLRTEGVVGILVESSDAFAALLVKALNKEA